MLRYERGADGIWQPAGRYDVGFYDRKNEGPPYVRAGAAGGAAFGMGYDASGRIDPARPDSFVWMAGDGLCAPDGPCLDPASGTESDASQVTGLQGQDAATFEAVVPDAAFQPYPAPGPAYPATGPSRSYMIDVDASGTPTSEALARNDATRVGDVVVFQQAAEKPDLQIVKRAIDPACHAGGDCRFLVTITNVGEVPYSGPLTVSDTPAEGAELTVPPSDWTCKSPFAGFTECSHDPVDLAPGAEISFEVAVRVPTWWSRPVFENCVDLTTPGAGEDARTYNNHACGYGPTAEPGTTYYAPDLRLSKFGIGQCDWTGECWFVVRITNVGAASYSGPLGFHDAIGYPGATLVGWGPGPGWMCGPPGGSDFTCTHAPVTLGPGDFREVLLRVGAPPPTPGHTHVGNCGWIDWGGGPGDYNPGNEYDCAAVSRFPPGFPDATAMLDVRKEATDVCTDGAGPGGGWACHFVMRVTNVGGAPFFGPIEISDTPTDPAATFISVTAPWTCVPGAGAAGTQTCTRPGVPGGLQPGESAILWMALEMPAAVALPGTLENCATVASDHNGDGIAEDHTSCATSQICHAGLGGDCPPDLSILKGITSLDPCFPGLPCRFVVRVHNIGHLVYHGPVDVTDTPQPGAGPLTIVSAPAGAVCVAAGANHLCSYPGDMAPGSELVYLMDFLIPPGYPATSFENCASIPVGLENIVTSNDNDCSTAFVPFPDMGPGGSTECKRGEDCTLPLGMKNFGLLPFVGTAGVRGVLSPAVPIVSITPETSGVTCSITGVGTYECLGHNLTVQPGESAKWSAVIHIAEDFPADQITHTKDMVWPDRKVKDKRPENDRNVSIITIEGPQEPTPPTPTRVHDLKVEKRGEASCRVGQPCHFTVVVTNVGEDSYLGEVVISDDGLPSARLTSYSRPWTCLGSGGHFSCTHPSTTLAPGESITLTLSFTTDALTATAIDNCATLHWTDTSRLRAVQQRLNELGFAAGEPDGKLGPQTRRAIMDYQESVHVPATGEVDNTLMARCTSCGHRRHQRRKRPQLCSRHLRADVQCDHVHRRPGDQQSMRLPAEQRASAGRHQCLPLRAPARSPARAARCRTTSASARRGTEVRRLAANMFGCVPVITCKGGKVENNQCVCPTGTEVQQVSRNAYACMPVPPSITCRNGTVRNNECVCPRGLVVEQTGRNDYRCVKPQPQITCKGGKIDNNQCICPRGTEVQRVGPNAFACAPVRPTITCAGGTVRNNECVCRRGMVSEQTGPNAYRCVRPQPQITCKGGKVDNDQCICPRGTEVRQVGRNAFACVKPPPQIRCSGGTVQNNQCVCPRGMEARRIGDNLYRCVKSQAQTPQVTPSAPTRQQFQLMVPQRQVPQ